MTNNYKEGDFVKIVTEYPNLKASLTYEGPLNKSSYNQKLAPITGLSYDWFVDSIESGLTGNIKATIEKITGPVPTEPGVYIVDSDDFTQGAHAYTLGKGGSWWFGIDLVPIEEIESKHKTYGLRKVA